MYKKVVEFSFTPTKNILVFSFWFQFIQRIEQMFVFFHPTYWQEIGSMKKTLLEKIGFTFNNLLRYLEINPLLEHKNLQLSQLYLHLLQNVFENGPN